MWAVSYLQMSDFLGLSHTLSLGLCARSNSDNQPTVAQLFKSISKASVHRHARDVSCSKQSCHEIQAMAAKSFVSHDLKPYATYYPSMNQVLSFCREPLVAVMWRDSIANPYRKSIAI